MRGFRGSSKCFRTSQPHVELRVAPQVALRVAGDVAIRYDTRRYFSVRSEADTSQLNLPRGTNN